MTIHKGGFIIFVLKNAPHNKYKWRFHGEGDKNAKQIIESNKQYFGPASIRYLEWGIIFRI